MSISSEINSNQQNGESASQEVSGLEGKYLTFSLSKEQYGIGILKIVEIFGVVNITHVPQSPDYVKGVINLRGKIIPVVDLRLKFGLEEKEYDEKTCIIVGNITSEGQEFPIGMIVDTVLEVRDFNSASLAPAPKYGSSLDTSFIVGIGKLADGEVSILVDIDEVFGLKEKELMTDISQSE